MRFAAPKYAAALLLLAACAARTDRAPNEILISIVGTNDVHGEISARDDRGGLTTISGYVNALRAARDEDGGAVLLIDAGDMWQGTLESNLSEGAAVVEAYNALGYAAAAIGNHEFDFGPSGIEAIPEKPGDDPRGALKQRASEASFPMLAANLIDESTGAAVDWPNVRPSTLVEVNGVKVGIIGIITANALQVTIAGPSGIEAIPEKPGDDPRGALKQRASEASFPMLAANLIDESTGAAVDWPNVRPSTLVEVNGVKVGIIGIITANALQVTIAANVVGLTVSPLAPTIEAQARLLRDSGAELIVVTARGARRGWRRRTPH